MITYEQYLERVIAFWKKTGSGGYIEIFVERGLMQKLYKQCSEG